MEFKQNDEIIIKGCIMQISDSGGDAIISIKPRAEFDIPESGMKINQVFLNKSDENFILNDKELINPAIFRSESKSVGITVGQAIEHLNQFDKNDILLIPAPNINGDYKPVNIMSEVLYDKDTPDDIIDEIDDGEFEAFAKAGLYDGDLIKCVKLNNEF